MGHRLPANNRRSSCPDKKVNRSYNLFCEKQHYRAGQDDFNSNQREEWEDPRFEDNHICLKLRLKCSNNRNSGVLLAGVEAPSPQQLVVTPRRQQSQEVGVGGGWRSPE